MARAGSPEISIPSCELGFTVAQFGLEVHMKNEQTASKSPVSMFALKYDKFQAFLEVGGNASVGYGLLHMWEASRGAPIAHV